MSAGFDYLEAADAEGKFASATFSLRAQKASATYYLKNGEDETAAVLDLLGDVQPSGKGGLKRKLPKCHPKYPWLYAGAVTVAGRGLPKRVPSSQAYAQVGADPAADEYLEHPVAALQVEYGPLAFPVLPDAEVKPSSVTWYDVDGSSVTSTYAPEGTRFSWADRNPKAEVITATQGQMVFRAQTKPPDGTSFSGRPQLRLPGGRVDVHWVQVPYSYVLGPNSYIAKFQGRVNQTPFLRWQPGELLYECATVTPYPPPVPAIDESLGDGVFSAERLCDVVFHLFEAVRVQPDATLLPNSSDITNKNWVVGGHNLLPHVKYGFLYATSAGNEPVAGQTPPDAATADAAAKDRWRPTFQSAPLWELLFSDPAVP